jgi:hypothetical protein
MSTILKALRRLEEDASAEETHPSDSLPATDPRATDELRRRILDEEQAAADAQAEQHNRSLMAQPIARALAAAAVLVTAVGLGVFVVAPRFISTDSQTPSSDSVTDVATPAPYAPIAQPERIASAANPPAVSDRAPTLPPTRRQANEEPSEPTRSRAARANAPARPTPSADLAQTASVAAAPISIRSRPTPVISESATQDSASASSNKDPIQSGIGSSTRSSVDSTISSTISSTNASTNRPSINAPIELARESASDQVSDVSVERIAEPQVQQHVAPPTPDIAVLQTAWHPIPDRRSAKIRLLENDETLTLHEGDAVGPLVVGQITPSAVIFLFGEIELRLRVGQP